METFSIPLAAISFPAAGIMDFCVALLRDFGRPEWGSLKSVLQVVGKV
ncbi:MAG: hypothetical protein VCA12_06795 [Pseudomonadales bacterium]